MTETVRIYRPTKTAMQSGKAKSKEFILEFPLRAKSENDRLMGWSGNGDTDTQVRLRFNSLELALAFAKQNGLTAVVQPDASHKLILKSYADNFRFDRVKL